MEHFFSSPETHLNFQSRKMKLQKFDHFEIENFQFPNLDLDPILNVFAKSKFLF